MMNKEGKNRKPLVLIIALVAAIVILGVVLGVLLSQCTGRGDENVQNGEYLLYWNLERGQNHEADKDGYYSFKFAYLGKPVTRKTASAEVAKEIDALDVMGLVIENGVVTGVQKIEDFTGGYACEGNKVYVASVDNNVITAKPDLSGDTKFELTTDKSTVVYDVSGETSPIGGLTKLREEDRFLAVLNKDGVVSQIFVISRKDLGNTHVRYCDHCKQEVKWTLWEKVTVLPAADSGHYFLNDDVNAKAQTSLQADTEIIIDLNGYTIYGKEDNRIFSLHNQGAYLAIMDYSEKQTGKLVAGESMMLIHQGACVWVRFGMFELFGGTLDASKVYCVNNGAAVCVPKDSVFNMYGGTITGGTIATTYDQSTEKLKAGMGGNVYVDGTFNMYGGVIEKGKAEAYYFRDTNSYSNGLGGNVYVARYGTFNMTGGEVKNGSAHGGGANVFINAGATFNMSGDAKITGGATTKPGKNGGSVYVPANATFNMDGGTITGGKTTNRGGNMVIYGNFNMTAGTIADGYCVDADGNEYLADWSNIFVVNGQNVNISGGHIKGHMYLMEANGNTYNVNISGTAKISGAAEGYANLFVRTGNPINVGKMEEGAEVYVTATGNFSTKTAEANKKYFHVDYKGVPVSYYEKSLFAGRLNCLCGTTDGKHFGECDGKKIGWGAWTSKDSLPTTTGNYYLVNDISLRGQMSVTNEATIALDLNGKTVTGKDNQRIYSLHATEVPVSITLTDSSTAKTGKCVAVSTEPTVNEGLLFWLRSSTKPHTLTIYGGTYDASEVVNHKNGAAIHGTAGSTINIYGGTVIGGTAQSYWVDGDKPGFSGGRGGTLYTTGYFNMTGGTLTGGKAVSGTHEGDTKIGDAYGGNLVLAGDYAVGNITGGTIEGGSAVLGGNIYLGNKAILNMTGMTVQNGVAENNGGNIYMGQTTRVTMTGGQILGGKNTAEGSNGGSIYITGPATYVMKGGLVSGGQSMNMGGNFDVRGTLQIDGGEVKDGLSKNGDNMHSAAAVHSNIAVVNLGTSSNNGKLIMTGGHVYGGVNAQTETGVVFTNITVSGDAKITKPEGRTGLNLRADGYVTVLGLSENAEIWVEKGVGSLVAVSGSEAPLTETDAAAFKHSMCVAALEDGKVYMRATVANVSTAQDLKDALEAGRDVKLAANITYDLSDCITLTSGTTVNLDLNGYTITHTNTDRLVNLLAGSSSTVRPSSLTITDSSAAGTGAITSTGTGMFRVNTQATYGDAELYITGGNFSCTGAQNVFWAKATEITGGTFSEDPTAFVPNGYKVTASTDADSKTWYTVEENTTVPATGPIEVNNATDLKTNLEAGKDVKLTGDIAYNLDAYITLTAGTTVELDLNGYTITHTVTDRFVALLAGSSSATPSSLTIKDSSENGTGAIISSGTGMFRVNTQATYGDAELYITGGTFECRTVFWAKATEVTGGTFSEDPTAFVPNGYKVTTTTDADSKTWYTVGEEDPGVTTAQGLKEALEAGKSATLGTDITFENTNATSVFINMTVDTDVTLDLNGHKLTFNVTNASHTVQLNGSNLIITDSSDGKTGVIEAVYSGTGGHLFRVNGTDTMTIDAGTIRYVPAQGVSVAETASRNIIHSNGTVTVNGGTIINEVGGKTVYGYDGALNINGGQFNVIPSNTGTCVLTPKEGHTLVIPEGESLYCLVPVVGDGFTEVNNATLLKTILESDTGKARLTGDIELSNTAMISVTGEIVLDLNGHTITVSSVNNNVHMFQLSGTSKLTITDSSDTQTGTIKAVVVANGVSSHVFRVNSTDELILEKGTLLYEFADGITSASNNYRNLIHSNGTVTVEAAVLNNKVGGYTINSWGTTLATINGGSFSGLPTGNYAVKSGFELKDDDNDGMYTLVAVAGA